MLKWTRHAKILYVALLLLPVDCVTAASFGLSKGNLGVETYYYPRNGAPGQEHGNFAAAAQLEFYGELSDKWGVKFTPFARLDAVDESRNKFDAREAYVEYFDGPWMATAGMRKLSWSVTESVNLVPHQVVDILNQRDLAADPAGKEKLGTPMLTLGYQGDTFLLEGYLLPWFRDRVYPDTEAREHPFQGFVDLPGHVEYTSPAEQHRLGAAVRLETIVGSSNIAFIQYEGYAPQPTFSFDPLTGDLQSLYYLVDMSAVTAQAAFGTWLLKTETAYFNTGLNRSEYDVPDNYFSTVSGVEYTFIRPSATADLSLIAEWMYDDRGDGLDGVQFQNDVFLGVRWVANDLYGTEIMGGIVRDLEDYAGVLHLQFQRRIAEKWRLEAIFRAFDAEDKNPMSAITDDTLINIKLRYFF